MKRPTTETRTRPSTGSKYQQLVLNYEPQEQRPAITLDQLQPLLEDMREQIVQQVLDGISLLIDEANR